MNKTQNDSPLANLVVDACRFGPAPTRGREAAVIVVTLVLVAIVLVIVQPAAAVAAVAAVAILAGFAVRWTVGTRKWGQR